jgi:hypothetical protein
MKIHPIEQAINEQARSFVALDGLEKGIKGKLLTKQQIYHSRRRTEDILVEMVDNLRALNKLDQDKLKKFRRRRRRGPRVLAVRFDEIQERRCEAC